MNQIAQAAEIALASCPKSSWKAKPIYDSNDQRLAFESIKAQLLGEASKAQAKLFVMFIQWSLTGKWPKFRNAPVFFLNEILQWTAAKKSFAPEEDFPNTPPPWESKYAAEFFDRTALSWYGLECEIWARDLAQEFFDSQEWMFDQMHPLE